ncbi:MAG: sigma-54-dependent Fis family transcriptional regulator [Armatimonadetes bacterium]|nr:sigma-54-dependent Fis family transcriptional regulator [Armatimonadota bacterium]
MPETQARILVVDDDPIMHAVCRKALADKGYDIVAVTSGRECLDKLRHEVIDLVLLDYKMPDLNGIEVLRLIRTSDDPELGVVIITGKGTMNSAIEAFRLGAQDFVTKPVSSEQLRAVVRQGLEVTRIKRHLRRFAREGKKSRQFEYLVGESAPMQSLFETIIKVSASPISSVLIRGETGTGKSLVAKAIHEGSPRASGPFIQVNCTAIPSDLVEMELFGTEKGAYTDAQERKHGLVEQAQHGTLFLDEIGHVPAAIQPKLLNLIEERKVRRLGGREDIEVDVRIVAATNRNLEKAIDSGDFRADLFYRLNVIPITVPPLRERGRDVLLLAHHFTQGFAKEFGKTVRAVSPMAEKSLISHSWPGNVRELKNAVERAVLLVDRDVLQETDFSLTITTAPVSPSTPESGSQTDWATTSLEEVEKAHILNVLQRAHGNRSHAARILGVSTETLRRKLKEWKQE